MAAGGRKSRTIVLLLFLGGVGGEEAEAGTCETPRQTLSIAFGSCVNHRTRVPTLEAAAASAPDVFVFLGDNLYNDLDRWGVPCEPAHCDRRIRALTSPLLRFTFDLLPSALQRYVLVGRSEADSETAAAKRAARVAAAPDVEALSRNYAMLARRPEMVALRRAVPTILATWDDHDFGRNDESASYPHAARSRELFLKFWRGGDAAPAARGGRAGVYEAYAVGAGQERAQLLLLDLRSFRAQAPRVDQVGALSAVEFAARCATVGGAAALGEYCAHAADSSAALLGEEQWAWLEAELRKPAALRVICSSLAFGSQFHAMEAWSLHPSERARLIALVNSTRAEGVVFASGDVHYAELSRLQPAGMYPLYDLTSSGLNQDWPSVPANANRVAGPVSRHNWGRIDVDWARRALALQIFDAEGALALHRRVDLDELRFPGAMSAS